MVWLLLPPLLGCGATLPKGRLPQMRRFPVCTPAATAAASGIARPRPAAAAGGAAGGAPGLVGLLPFKLNEQVALPLRQATLGLFDPEHSTHSSRNSSHGVSLISLVRLQPCSSSACPVQERVVGCVEGGLATGPWPVSEHAHAHASNLNNPFHIQ
jgi:hypothetical protein